MPYPKLFLALLLLIASAYISVTLPISEKEIPFSAQSLIVFYIAGVCRARNTIAILGAYLFLGILGLPVFAEGTAGWAKVLGPSGGFLYGFVVSGWVISSFMQRFVYSARPKRIDKIIGIMLIGTFVLFGFGLSHLAYAFGWGKALEYGLYPFWMMGLVKAIMASLLVFWSDRRWFN